MINFLCLLSAVSAIIGGHSVPAPTSLPFYVLLTTHHPSSSNSHQCGGTLIDYTTILTSARCADHITDKTEVTAHRNNLAMPMEQQKSVSFVIMAVNKHPKFNSERFEFDIAVLKVHPITPSPSAPNVLHLKFPALNTFPLETFFSSELVVAGYGHTQMMGKPSVSLLAAAIPLVTNFECSNDFPNLDLSVSFCAGDIGPRDPGYIRSRICTGDQGGPIITVMAGRFYLIGISSEPRYLCSEGLSVFTDIKAMIPFIQQFSRPFTKSH